MNNDIVARLRVLNHHAKTLAENESLHDLHRDALTRCENLTWQAADEIERLRELLGNSEQLRIERSEMVNAANMLRNGTHRVYMVRANDYSRGTVMPVRIATAKTLAAMINRCAKDCYGRDAKEVGVGSWDLSVIVTVGELEVQSE